MKSSPRLTGHPGGLAIRVEDGLSNVITGMGGARDRSTFMRWSLGRELDYGPNLIDAGQIDAAYMTSGLVRLVHDLIPEDMTREWRSWSLDADLIALIEAEEKRLNIEAHVFEALRLARLRGGAGLLLGLPGPSREEAPETVGRGDLGFVVPLSRDYLKVTELVRDPGSPYFMQPPSYRLDMRDGRYVEIHPSRVIPFKGLPNAGGQYRPTVEDEFWGRPLMESLNTALQNAVQTQGAIASLVPEAKTDMISIPGLTDMVSTADGESRLARRLQAAQMMKSMYGVGVLDGGTGAEGSGEKWETRQLTWSGLPDIGRFQLQVLSGETGIPMTRFTGEQAKGLNNGGEQDERNYNTLIRTKQKRDLKPGLDRLDRYMVPSAGVRLAPDQATWTFSPLHTQAPKEQAEDDHKIAETYAIIRDSGLVQNGALAETLVARLGESPNFPGLVEAVAASGEDIPANVEAQRAELDAKANRVRTLASASGGQLRLRSVSRDALMMDAAPRTLYISRKVMNPQEVLRHFRAQGLEGLTAAADLHVTIMHTEMEVDWMALPADWSSERDGRLRIPPGGPRAMEAFGPLADTLVLAFKSNDLEYRHSSLRDFGLPWKWGDYQPHITLAKIATGTDISALKPYTGRIVLGPEIFEEVLP